jgi:hypothetical protein
MALGGLIGRFAGQNLLKAWNVGKPTWTDVAINAFPSLLYGGTMLTQGANPGEAAGTAVTDLGMQMVADAALGTVGARLGMKFAPQRYKDLVQRGGKYSSRVLDKHAAKWGQMAKMGSMATMLVPNPVANSFYERMQQQQLGPAGVGGTAAAPALSQEEDAYASQLMAGLDPEQQQYAAALLGGGV